MEGINKELPTFDSLGLTKKEPLKNQRLTQEDFMELMMAQMKHQDPMKPMENGEFISQMAQFSSVEGLKEIKDSFKTLADALHSSQALQASSMVGRQVLIPGDKTSLPENGVLTGAVNVPQGAEKVIVKVFDQKGQMVHSVDLGQQSPGVAQFKWDGTISKDQQAEPGVGQTLEEGSETPMADKAAAGRYTLRAEIMTGSETVAADTLVVDKVESVSLSGANQGVTLNLSNSGSTGLSQVQEIL
jgi:flagellar basal-body rod modification protein FlgD